MGRMKNKKNIDYIMFKIQSLDNIIKMKNNLIIILMFFLIQ